MEDWVRVCGEKGKGEAAVLSWEDKGERRMRASQQSRMAGTWWRWPAAVTRAAWRGKIERGREGEADKRARRGIFIFLSFFSGL